MNLRNGVIGILAVIVIAIGFAISNFLASKKAQPTNVASTKYVPTVQTNAVLNQPVQVPVALTGSVEAVNKISLFSEVQGLASFAKTPFKVGNTFKKGDVILAIDDTEFRLTIQSQRSRLANLTVAMLADLGQIDEAWIPKWEAFLVALKPDKSVPNWPTITDEREQRFVNARNLPETYFSIKSQEARLVKYQMIAPFDGMVTAATVNSGALVRNGQSLGEFTGTNQFELKSAVAVSDIGFVRVGNEVSLTSKVMKKTWKGTINRISNIIDASSQMVDVFVNLGSGDEQLRDGLFLEGVIQANQTEEVYVLPRKLLLDNKYVYGVYENKLMRYEVIVMKLYEDKVLVKGLENGTKLLTELIAGAYEGMPVNLVN